MAIGRTWWQKSLDVKTACIVFLACMLPLLSIAGSSDPFPMGYSMGNNGTILQANAVSGRQPWTPACFYRDTFRFGFSGGGIDYYDPMDNSGASRICQAIGGAWYSPKNFSIKASYAYLGALGMYSEQEGFVSIAAKAFPAVIPSIELKAFRAGLMDGSAEHSSFLLGGLSVLASARYAAFSLSAINIPLKSPIDHGIYPPVTLRTGVHTVSNDLGAQGILLEISKEQDFAFRVSVGEEYFLNRNFSVCTALATNPFMLYFGASFAWTKSSASIAFVNHPVLGWSKGLCLDWVR